MSRLNSKLPMLDRMVADLRANATQDPLAHLTEKERHAIEQYRKVADPINQFLDAITGNNPAALFDESPITQGMSDAEAQEVYERELGAFRRWFNRRQAFRKANKK